MATASQAGSTHGTVTVSLHDAAGRVVDVDWTRQDGAGGTVFSFATATGAAAVREAHVRIVVQAGDHVLTDHVHRATFTRS